jgi:hypothetical protein
LQFLDFPSDVVEAVENGGINLFKVEHLAHVLAKRFRVTPG